MIDRQTSCRVLSRIPADPDALYSDPLWHRRTIFLTQAGSPCAFFCWVDAGRGLRDGPTPCQRVHGTGTPRPSATPRAQPWEEADTHAQGGDPDEPTRITRGGGAVAV